MAVSWIFFLAFLGLLNPTFSSLELDEAPQIAIKYLDPLDSRCDNSFACDSLKIDELVLDVEDPRGEPKGLTSDSSDLNHGKEFKNLLDGLDLNFCLEVLGKVVEQDRQENDDHGSSKIDVPQDKPFTRSQVKRKEADRSDGVPDVTLECSKKPKVRSEPEPENEPSRSVTYYKVNCSCNIDAFGKFSAAIRHLKSFHKKEYEKADEDYRFIVTLASKSDSDAARSQLYNCTLCPYVSQSVSHLARHLQSFHPKHNKLTQKTFFISGRPKSTGLRWSPSACSDLVLGLNKHGKNWQKIIEDDCLKLGDRSVDDTRRRFEQMERYRRIEYVNSRWILKPKTS